MNIVAIIQARMGSTRLPGKVLAELAGQPMLERVCRRVQRAGLVDRVVVATTQQPADQEIVEHCRQLDVACFRGSEDDVLDRYDDAARANGAEVIVRITADCPLIDPGVIDEVIGAFLNKRPDYASNVLERTWPRGLDTEVFSMAALRRAWHEATEAYQRIHVTPWFYQNPDRFRLLSVVRSADGEIEVAPARPNSGEFGYGTLADKQPVSPDKHRWTVDSPEDLQFARAVHERLDDADGFTWRDVMRLLDAQPELAELNRHIRQKQLVEG